MFKGHPWEGERYGGVEYEWFLRRHYELDVMFEVNLRPFLEFCREKGQRANELTMKIATRLSTEHLPQYMLSLKGRPYPTRYPAGYVRPIRPGRDMIEHIAVREKDNHFGERAIRDSWKPIPRYLAEHHPRISAALASWFPKEETNNNYTLMVSRNPLRGLNARTFYFGSHYRTMCLAVPFGEKVFCGFTAPHAFGNINYFEPFMERFKTYSEDPEQIPADIIQKPYRPVVSKEQRKWMEREKKGEGSEE